MTDRIKGFIVVLERDLREDDADGIKNAILALRGVSGVTSSVVNGDDYMNRVQALRDLKHKIWKLLDEE